MKILISGSKGGIGKSLVDYFKDHTNYEIYDFYFDITNSESIKNVIKDGQYDLIINCAALANIPESFIRPFEFYDVNIKPILYFCEFIKRFSPQTKFVNLGSVLEFSNRDPYSASKAAARKIIESYSNSIWGIQPYLANVILSRNDDLFVIPKITNYFKKGQFSKPLGLGNVFSSKCFLDILDVCEGLFKSISQDEKFSPIFAAEKPVSIREIVQIAAESIGIYGKWDILNNNHVFMDKVQVYVINNPNIARPNESIIEYDIEETKKILGWCPKISIKESINKMILQ